MLFQSTYFMVLPLPVNLLRMLTNVNPVIINYHVVSDQRLPHISHLYRYRNTKTFAEDLKYFKRKYNPIGIEEFLDSVKNKTPLPRNSFMLTFDDGFREVYEVAVPVLQKMKLTSTIFITSQYLNNTVLGYDQKKSIILEQLTVAGNNSQIYKVSNLLKSHSLPCNEIKKAILSIPYRQKHVVDEIANTIRLDMDVYLKEHQPYLTTQQVKELHNMGFTFGGHGLDHPRFIELSPEERIDQAIASVEFMVKLLNLDYRVFAFPYSDLNLPIEFYQSISDKIDATFGTQGMLKDKALNNFHRINVEKTNQPAFQTLRFHYIKQIVYQLVNKDRINRS
jgi:peptidoglycan/xylan/chitin deacetylase (PgdA/CDA1 family)